MVPNPTPVHSVSSVPNSGPGVRIPSSPPIEVPSRRELPLKTLTNNMHMQWTDIQCVCGLSVDGKKGDPGPPGVSWASQTGQNQTHLLDEAH
mmetsp:Transcript_29634/g.47837  ORF Transcript_29634/g.47837 Transcript_29634/m.47837 type:complete len:92 (+) Transcript_29634:1558-1833(+)